jgi:hypothetical protein
VARWIYGFRETAARELTEAERAALRRRFATARLVAGAFGLLVPVCFVAFVAAISFAVERPPLGVAAVVVCLYLGFKAFDKAGKQDQLALIYRRAARLGVAQAWTRDTAPPPVREAYTLPPRSPEEEDEEADVTLPEGGVSFWEMEERFDRELERALGRPAQWFETIGEDTVVLAVEDKTVTRYIHAPIVSVRDR